MILLELLFNAVIYNFIKDLVGSYTGVTSQESSANPQRSLTDIANETAHDP